MRGAHDAAQVTELTLGGAGRDSDTTVDLLSDKTGTLIEFGMLYLGEVLSFSRFPKESLTEDEGG